MSRMITVRDITLEVEERGEGRPLLFLHAGEGLAPDRPWLDLLARHYRVIAPHHPGWGRSTMPKWLCGVEDLAYLYLDLAAQLGLSDAVLVGGCLGGWIGAEMAVRDTRRFGHLALVDPLGIKVGGVQDRDIADMHAIDRAEFLRLAWADPSRGAIDLTRLTDEDLTAIARSREAFAQLGWNPYMHNPRLRRWLHRIDLPTLMLWGAQDGIVTEDFGRCWRDEIPDARFESIPDAGHFPYWEQPQEFVSRLVQFTRKQ